MREREKEKERERERERETDRERESGYPTNIASGWLYVWLSSPYCLLEREREYTYGGCSQSSPKRRVGESMYTHGGCLILAKKQLPHQSL